MNTQAEMDVTVTGTLISATDQKIVLAIPHTDYQIHLMPTVAAHSLTAHVGKRIKGVIHAQSLRIHATSELAGGGRFIEPVIGVPRIVAGRVKSTRQSENQLVVDVAVPFVVSPLPEQDWSILEVGGMVNFYIRSGATFTPRDPK